MSDDRLRRLSAAFDGEDSPPEDLDIAERRFLDDAEALRARFRLTEADTPPDVSAAVLDVVAGRTSEPAQRTQLATRRHPTPLPLLAAAVFVVAALAAVILLRPDRGSVASADVDSQVVAAQQRVDALDARVTLVEYGVHPDVPVRRASGTLRYRAPERLWLSLEEQSVTAPGWPANDLDIVVADGTASTAGLAGCPVFDQPGCLHPRAISRTGLAPFAADWIDPLDLIVPVDAFRLSSDTAFRDEGGSIVIETTVARVQRLVDGLRAAGAVRAVHATDPVTLRLDSETFVLRQLSVTAGDSEARAAFASTLGYDDEPDEVILDLVVDETTLPDLAFPTVASGSGVEAGFDDGPVAEGPVPHTLPDGFEPHRSGILVDGGGPRTVVQSWSDGRAWIRVSSTNAWAPRELFGLPSSLVRPVVVGEGLGFVDPTQTAVALHGDAIDVVIEGSVSPEVLLAVAASLDIAGRPLPDDWPQSGALTVLPAGALRPPGALTAAADGFDVLVAVPGPGATDAILLQYVASALPPPPKSDVIEAEVRGVLGRYAPRLGTLTWFEAGWVRELTSAGVGLEGLQAIAASLEPA